MLNAFRHRVTVAIVTLSLPALCSPAFALDPALDVNQYSHTKWTIRDGFIKGAIRSITQTSDGYLWLGTEFGVVRFDGVRAVPWQPPADQPLPSDDIWSVLGSRDGALWVGTAKGLARWKDGSLTLFPEVGDRIIGRLLEGHENTVWVSALGVPAGRLCAIRGREVKCDGDDGRFGYGIWALREDRGGSLWLGIADGIWRWTPGPPVFFAMAGEGDRIQAFAEDSDGTLLITTGRGIRRFLGARTEPYEHSVAGRPLVARRLLRDRDGALWIATRGGLVHAREGKTDHFARADGLSGDDVEALFEDREGNIWIATSEGLDRFRNVVVSAVSENQGLSNPRVSGVRASVDGTIWLSTTDSLEKWDGGHFTSYRGGARRPVPDKSRQIVVRGIPDVGLGALFADDRGRTWIASTTVFGYLEGERFVVADGITARAVRSMAQDSDANLWVADQQAGLLRLSPGGNVGQFSWAAMGRKDFATSVTADRVRGGVWLGFWDGGIGRFENGRIREAYTAASGLGRGRITNLRFAIDGSLWVATQGGLSRVSDGKVATLTRKNGLPCEVLHWVIWDDAGSLWMDSECGLVRVTEDDLGAWIADATHVIRPVLFDSHDGVRMQAIPNGSEPYVAKAPDGRLWFLGPNGLNVLDPRRLNLNDRPPLVHVERIVANRSPFDIAPGGVPVVLPPLTSDLQIDYTALSLVAPEKMRFRYMLEGHDREWQDVGSRRQAFYTNLPPRAYRFRVTASNNSGVWNDTGAILNFSVAPAYYQTAWFKALSIATALVLVWGGHRFRLRVAEKHQREISALNERLMKAQEQERIRIAGELHDGVMQEMLAVTMMLGAARRRIPDNSEARATIDKAQHKLIQAGTDIRQLSHDLHPPLLQEAGLPKAVRSYCEQFSSASRIPVACEAEESAGELSRGAALALFRIVQEALGNAAKYAAATRISVGLNRSEGVVSLTVSDDGVGFDRTRLATGGLGLVMMRERASQLNGTFEFETAPGRGTTVRVVVPFR